MASTDKTRTRAQLPADMTLYTFSFSQSSEKIRWILDVLGLAYHEERMTPFFHLSPNLRMTGGFSPSVPILRAGGEIVQDSTRIIEWLDERYAPLPLLSKDPETRTAIMNAESRFDMAGPHVVRLMYDVLLGRPEQVRRMWARDAGWVRGLALRASFPALQAVFRRGIGSNEVALAYSRRLVERAMNEIDRAVEQGNEYLQDGRLTVADITAAARLAPLVCPPQHPVFGDEGYRDALAPLIERWRGRPAFDWVLRRYRQDRLPRPAAVTPVAENAGTRPPLGRQKS